ncbi:MFS transporter [Fodinicola acaciae]|uniref:MFS transporter n=1 Tax=Fodinicola acaciae TaxID=2681555 RepID=UPI001C9E9CAB|nr:MFS transporter [Fodinicola acaciae]
MTTTVQRPAVRLPRTTSFWVLAAIQLAFMAAAATPSPLYVVYQAQWHFSAIVLTVIFGVYAIALLAALMVTGALSDHIGRRPVLIAALAAETVSMLVFIGAQDVGWLVAARVLQGLATGAATGAISASLVDLQPRPGAAAPVNSATPAIGLAAGALFAGVLVEYLPAPTVLVFVLLTALFVAGIVAMLLVPETSGGRPGAVASLRPRVAVPAGSAGRFLAVMPTMIGSWSVVGFLMSLGPSIAASVLGVRDHLVGGLVVAAVMGAGAVGSMVARGRAPRRLMVRGGLILPVGLAVTLIGLSTTSTWLFFAGTILSGLGFGGSFLGAFTAVSALAEPDQRAALFATVYTVNYLAFSVPSVLAGALVGIIGLTTTAMIFGIAVIVLSLAAVVLAAGRAVAPAAAD